MGASNFGKCLKILVRLCTPRRDEEWDETGVGDTVKVTPSRTAEYEPQLFVPGVGVTFRISLSLFGGLVHTARWGKVECPGWAYTTGLAAMTRVQVHAICVRVGGRVFSACARRCK
jgi:hypothetical protein